MKLKAVFPLSALFLLIPSMSHATSGTIPGTNYTYACTQGSDYIRGQITAYGTTSVSVAVYAGESGIDTETGGNAQVFVFNINNGTGSPGNCVYNWTNANGTQGSFYTQVTTS